MMTDPGIGSTFVNSLCDALTAEYNVTDAEKEKGKKDLVSLYHSVVIPRVGRGGFRKQETVASNLVSYTVKQTPELRSSLTKTIRFRPIGGRDIRTEPIVIYDGLKDDPSFQLGRSYYEALGYKK